MVLVDDGVLRLDDRVDSYLPELADRRVLTSIGAALDETVAAARPLTVEDLLSFRMGFGTSVDLDWSGPGLPIQQAERELGLCTLGPPWPPPAFDDDEWIRRFATLPLMAQPGEQWMYNTGLQVLGVLLSRAARRPLPALLGERVLGPLGMVDTGFHVPPASIGRLTAAYQPTDDGLALLDPGDAASYWASPPLMHNAAGWLVSTLDDLWAFAPVDGRRWRRTVEPGVVRAADDEPPDGSAALGEHAVPRRRRLGPRHGHAGRRPRRVRLGRRDGHDVAHRSVVGRHRHPAHPAGVHLARAAARRPGLLGRDALRRPRCRGRLT